MNANAFSRRRQRGFTLIELMIVAAIIAILAAIAIPQYQGYVIRSRYAAAYAEMTNLKNQTMVAFATDGDLRSEWQSEDYRRGTRSCKGVSVSGAFDFSNAQLMCTYIPGLPFDGHLVLKATMDNVTGAVSWKCGAYTGGVQKYEKYLPKPCSSANWYSR